MTEPQYWVRRQGRIHGPFSRKQISGGVQSGKLTLQDELSSSKEGPWSPIETVERKRKASAPANLESIDPPPIASTEPVASSAQVTKTPSSAGETDLASVAAELRTGNVFDRPSGQLTITNNRVRFVPRNILKSRPALEILLEDIREVSEVDELGGLKKGVSLRTKTDDVYDFFVLGREKILGVVQSAIASEEVQSRVRASAVATTIAGPSDESSGSAVFRFEGINDVLEVFSDRLTITPKGVLGFLNKGLKGTKEIPFQSIVAVQLKEAGGVFSGFIQFSILGGNESRGGLLAATKDENTVMFARAAENTKVRKIKEYIDLATRQLREPKPTAKASDGLAGELQRLVALKEQGVLTDEEFQQAKRKLIS